MSQLDLSRKKTLLRQCAPGHDHAERVRHGRDAHCKEHAEQSLSHGEAIRHDPLPSRSRPSEFEYPSSASAVDVRIAPEHDAVPETKLERHGPDHPIRVMIVDDHRIVREGLVGLLQEEPDIEVVAQATDGFDALKQFEAVDPNVVIMDVTMSGMNGVEATNELLKMDPDIRIIGLSMHAREDMAEAMLRAGAAAYLSKGSPAVELIDVIRRIA